MRQAPLHPPPTRTREQRLTGLLTRIERLRARGQQASASLTRWRLAIFVAGVLCSVIPYKLAWYQIGNVALGVFALTFIIVAGYHNKLEGRLHRLHLWRDIKRTHLARIGLEWDTIPSQPAPPSTGHPYAADLDLVGRHSLLHLLDTTVSSHGRERLTSWFLSQPPTPGQWEARQRLVQELSGRPLVRDRLRLEAQLIGEQEINGRRLLAVLATPAEFRGLVTVLTTQALLAVTTFTLILGSALNWLPNYWLLSFGAYALLYMMTDRGEELFEHAISLHLEMEKLGAVLQYLERHARKPTSELGRLCAPLMSHRTKPSRYVRLVARTMHALSVKAHPLVHIAINAIGPWDLWFTLKLQRLQHHIHEHLPMWLDKLAEVEAASALGTFAYLHPEYHWPTVVKDTATQRNGRPAMLSAQELGHPLLRSAHRVTNSLDLRNIGRIMLVTGSNMSGKSTFLRTIGINMCLAQAGAPVCASRFEWSWVRIVCCIRVDDSLEAGLSFFYAEVKRLKQLLDATQDRTAPPVLFLIDEIFKGTNNRERLIGSRAYIAALAQGNGFGLVSTHDLELTDLEREIPNLMNAHFQETVEANVLKFDYTLRPGPCPTTNALRIMELEGLPVSEKPQ